MDDWNALPAQVVEAETVQKFEIELDKYIGMKCSNFENSDVGQNYVFINNVQLL